SPAYFSNVSRKESLKLGLSNPSPSTSPTGGSELSVFTRRLSRHNGCLKRCSKFRGRPARPGRSDVWDPWTRNILEYSELEKRGVATCNGLKNRRIFGCTIVVQMLPNSGSLHNDGASRP